MRVWAIALLLGACGSPQASPGGARALPPPQTIDGEVIRVTSDSSQDALASGVHLVVQPEGRHPVRVALAPGWYLDEHGLRFEPGDRVHAAGAPSGDVFVASDVSKGKQSVRLRDASGRPLWTEPSSKGASP